LSALAAVPPNKQAKRTALAAEHIFCDCIVLLP
jgi:hypothetical protein